MEQSGKEQISSPTQKAGNRKLHDALKRLNEGWFPVNPQHLERIQKGLRQGAYDFGVEFLIAEVKKDFALFMYCLREVRNELKKRKAPLPQGIAPTNLLELGGVEVLKKVLLVTPAAISSHKLKDVDSIAGKKIQESMVSASTAEFLAERTGRRSELSFSTGLMRQLGLTLIAWNYPSIYERTVTSAKDCSEIDKKLTSMLGFSPKLLAIALARQWGLCSELRAALGDQSNASSNPDTQKRIAETADYLSHLCKVGEALARANSPEVYPSARTDWKSAKSEIMEILGDDGVTLIQERITENCESYIQLAPSLFKNAKAISKEPAPRLKAGSIHQHNRYIKSCPQSLQERLIDFYQMIEGEKVSQDQLNVLIREIIPSAGFPDGAILLLDPDSMMLTPRVVIGTPDQGRIRERASLSISVAEDDPILAAYNCNTPIIESKGAMAQEGRASIACVLGKNQRVGVLYLELDEGLVRSLAINPLLCYKALCQALCDCLRLT